MYGEKIWGLNLAIEELLAGFLDLTLASMPGVAAITFGKETVLYPFVPLDRFSLPRLEAFGDTKLTEALAMASEIATDETITLLVSDGAPNDGRFSKAPLKGTAFAMAIGYDADPDLLSRFTGYSDRVFPSVEARSLPGYWYANFITRGAATVR